MKHLGLVLALVGTSGCATTWIATEASGAQGLWDEHVREELVPLPGIAERLTVALPLAIQYTSIPSATPNAAPTTGPAKPFALTCDTAQSAHSIRYHSAFRYGSFWGKSTAISFLIEGALATAFLLAARTDRPGYYAYGGFFAVDAAVTGAIFFIPRKEIYREDPIAITTPLRIDCPEGLALVINGTPYPVDAAGRVGELAEAALAAWMSAPQGVVQTTFDGQLADVPIGAREQCAWLRDHAKQSCLPGQYVPPAVVATFDVRAGTLTASTSSRP